MPTELGRRVVHGATMGTRFSAVFYAPPDTEIDGIAEALTAAVTEVDREMSTWNPDSDLMRFNRARAGEWVALPPGLLTVLEAGIDIGRASSGAFDIGLLDHMKAWGFQSQSGSPVPDEINRVVSSGRLPAHEVVVIEEGRGTAMKRQPCAIDLSGIAKGFGVDRLAETLIAHGIGHFLVSIDGELRAAGGKPDGSPWRIAVEQPDPKKRDVAGVIDLFEGAIATSGNYRHRRKLGDRSYSHTIDPRTGEPIADDTYSATVRARTCMEADAWATVVMVLGQLKAGPLLAARGISAMTIQPEASQAQVA